MKIPVIISVLLLILSCEKPIDIALHLSDPKFFITAEIIHSESNLVPIRISIDYFNASRTNSPFDTSEFNVFLYDKNGRIELSKKFGNSNFGNGNFNLYCINKDPYECLPGTIYTLKCVYKNDSFVIQKTLPETIQSVQTEIVYNNPFVVYTYHKVNDNQMDLHQYFLRNRVSDLKFYSFENVNNSNILIPNSLYSGCFVNLENKVLNSYIIKAEQSTANMLNQYSDVLMNNEINNNPFFIP